jgi:hypothetical protein
MKQELISKERPNSKCEVRTFRVFENNMPDTFECAVYFKEYSKENDSYNSLFQINTHITRLTELEAFNDGITIAIEHGFRVPNKPAPKGWAMAND